MKRIWRWSWRGAIILFLLLAAYDSLYVWPGPFFSYCVGQDRLSLCSDRKFNALRARRLLSEVAVRLARSPLNDGNNHRIFISNASWRIALFMSRDRTAAAFSVYPLSRNVFARHADIDADILFHASGEPAQPPRTLTYYVTHEFTHALTGERLGMVRNAQLPIWVREGYADYVGMRSGDPDDDPVLLYRRYRAHDPIFDSGDRSYFRYRMLTAYFLTQRGWSIDKLLATDLTVAEAQREMDQDPVKVLK